ncbi:MAG: aminoglycoside phosphotransferase family protein [Longispora sp.]|nr:aminoglycoside phosphotransferase family protein [Longispora sp. (in: high G+C Gram-positive bacteria)]
MTDLDRPWTGGPYGEPARALLSAHARHVEQLLIEFDRLVDRVQHTAADWVVTHGEPHPGNLLRTPTGLRLLDWDTVQIAPPERDLWMLTRAFATMLGENPADNSDDAFSRYTKATGRTVTPTGLTLYPLW